MTAGDDHPDAQAPCCSPVTAGVIDEAAAVELAAVLKALADPVRVRLVSIIGGAPSGEVCACDLPELLDRSQPTVSHHLTLLVRAGLIDREQRVRGRGSGSVPRASQLCVLRSARASASTNRFLPADDPA